MPVNQAVFPGPRRTDCANGAADPIGLDQAARIQTDTPHQSLTCTHISFCTLKPNLFLLAARQRASPPFGRSRRGDAGHFGEVRPPASAALHPGQPS